MNTALNTSCIFLLYISASLLSIWTVKLWVLKPNYSPSEKKENTCDTFMMLTILHSTLISLKTSNFVLKNLTQNQITIIILFIYSYSKDKQLNVDQEQENIFCSVSSLLLLSISLPQPYISMTIIIQTTSFCSPHRQLTIYPCCLNHNHLRKRQSFLLWDSDKGVWIINFISGVSTLVSTVPLITRTNRLGSPFVHLLIYKSFNVIKETALIPLISLYNVS